MPLIHYVQHNGDRFEAEVPVGDSVMQGALDNTIDGIVAECGGAAVCATCHCIVDEQWAVITGGATSEENIMLEGAPGRQDNSRLSCQLFVSDELDGLVVHLPQSQY